MGAKKKVINCICIVVCLILALMPTCVRAETSSETTVKVAHATVSGSWSQSKTYYSGYDADMNFCGGVTVLECDYENYDNVHQILNYWNQRHSSVLNYTSNPEVYAYRVDLKYDSFSSTSDQVYYTKMCLGNYDSYIGGEKMIWGNSIGANCSFWLVTDYAIDTFYLFPVSYMYDLESWNTSKKIYDQPYLQVNLTCTATFNAYKVDDLMDDVYSKLCDVYSTDAQMLTTLNQIYLSVDTVETKLSSLITIANGLVDEVEELQGLVDVSNSYLAKILEEEEKQTTWLEKIYNALFNKDDESEVDEFETEVNDKADSLGDLTDDIDTVVKPTPEESVPDIEELVPEDNEGIVSSVFDAIMSNGYVVMALLIVFAFAFIGYVLFGKGG